MRKKHVMELLRVTARPPQERWSIRESVNFKIALGRYNEYDTDAQMCVNSAVHRDADYTFTFAEE